MKTRSTLTAILTAAVMIGSGGAWFSAAAAAPEAAKAPKAAWKIAGQLEEACSCNAACPCWFGSKPTRMTCGGGQILFIEKGTYGGTSLDGLAVGNVGQSPEGQTMMDSFGNWNFSYLYIDEKASPEQRKALEDIGRTVLPVAASAKVEVRFTPITRKIEGKDHKVSLGTYGNFTGHVVEGGLGGSSRIVNPPGADPLHKEYEQGTNSQLVFNDAGENWNFSGTNYMFANFTVDSEQYAKYQAGLSQKMAEKKKLSAASTEK